MLEFAMEFLRIARPLLTTMVASSPASTSSMAVEMGTMSGGTSLSGTTTLSSEEEEALLPSGASPENSSTLRQNWGELVWNSTHVNLSDEENNLAMAALPNYNEKLLFQLRVLSLVAAF